MLGLGFLPDGGARIPACPLQGHMAVIDDAVLPQRVPEETLDRLAARCGGGCCLDFLRTPGPVHRAVAQGLQRRLGNAPMLLPAAYHAFAPEALPVLSCLRPCNAWDGFVRSAERRFPNGWALELTPWEAELPAPPLPYPGGMLPAALCSCEKSPAGLRYFVTRRSRSGRSWRTQRHMAAAAPSVCGRSSSRFSRSGMDKTGMRLRAAFPCAA